MQTNTSKALLPTALPTACPLQLTRQSASFPNRVIFWQVQTAYKALLPFNKNYVEKLDGIQQPQQLRAVSTECVQGQE